LSEKKVPFTQFRLFLQIVKEVWGYLDQNQLSTQTDTKVGMCSKILNALALVFLDLRLFFEFKQEI